MAPHYIKTDDRSVWEMPPAGSRFFWLVFFAALTKKMNPVVGPEPDGFASFFSAVKPFKPSGLAPTGDWLSLHGPKKVSKERTALAAGMFVTVWFIE
jgi:hypothetical protein